MTLALTDGQTNVRLVYNDDLNITCKLFMIISFKGVFLVASGVMAIYYETLVEVTDDIAELLI